MDFLTAIRTVFSKYAAFSGRAGRAEFWWWALFTGLVSIAISIGESATTGSTSTPLAGLWGLAVLLPTLGVKVRRLRDGGFGWGHVFWVLLPGVGLVVLAVLLAQPSRARVAELGAVS